MKKNSISEQTMITIVWNCIMGAVEWNKKEELLTEQAIKHLKVNSGFFQQPGSACPNFKLNHKEQPCWEIHCTVYFLNS